VSEPELPSTDPLDFRDRSRAQTALSPWSDGTSANLFARYQLIVDNMSDIAVTALPGGTIDWVSTSIEAALGWTPDAVVGRTLSELLHPDDLKTVDDMQAHINSGSAPTAEARVLTSDGSYRWMSSKVTLVKDPSGAVIRRLAIWRDIDDEVELRTELRSLVDALLDPHVLLAPKRDKGGTIVDFEFIDANPAACTYLSNSRDELIGGTVAGRIPNDRPAGLLPMFAAVIDTGEPLDRDNVAYATNVDRDDRRFDLRAVKVGERLSLSWRDVTHRYEMVQAMEVSEEHYRLLSENSTNVVVKIQKDVMTFVSPSIDAILGWAPEEWLGHRSSEFAHPDDLLILAASIPSVEQGGNTVARFRLRSKSGEYHWLEDLSRPFLNSSGQPDGRIASMHLIDREVAAEQALMRRANRDAVTGLLSRSEVLVRLGAILDRQPRMGQRTAVAFCDIDHFKTVNDQYGHAAGDQVLTMLGQRIQDVLRNVDMVARFGGDEILVILDGVLDQSSGVAIAEKIRNVALNPIEVNGEPILVTLSVGVTMTTAADTTQTITARADAAMYQAKKTGRNKVIMI